ncbi:MAG: FHA domain-containing protein [Lachnospiraceae bacterium]|jgi:pSer/pThr/pTyr-binding forkhead associated (FHA) protein|nr:FHA domain-containing protein [Lachnospiraceae bacterium]
MPGKRCNNLTVIENGKLDTYILDDRRTWKVGRISKGNIPEIALSSLTVSRYHGEFRNIDGLWFYLDRNGKNGTVYNGRHITAGIGGGIKPVMLGDGDIMIFGGGEKAVIDSRTVWVLFSEKLFDGGWRSESTKDAERICFNLGGKSVDYNHPEIGMVVDGEDGRAVYMGSTTYLSGDIRIEMQ